MAYEEYDEINAEDSLSHHGIFGQKWGKKNGPPYPLSAGAHSAQEKKLNAGKYARDSSGNPVKSENTPGTNNSNGGGGGSSSGSSQQSNQNRQNNSQQHNTQQNNQNRSNNSENTGGNAGQKHYSRDDKESREYERNLKRQKRLNDQQYNQLKRYQNDIERQQRYINKQQRNIENQKAEVYRKELTNAQKERELREIRKQQRQVKRQQYAQQRSIRANNEKLLDAQMEQFRQQQGYGSPPKNVSYAPQMPTYNFSVPSMTLDDYKKYRAKKKAVKFAKTAGKTALIGTGALAVGAAVAGVAGLTLAGHAGHKTVRKVGGLISDNSNTLRRLGKNALEALGDNSKNLKRIGGSALDALTEGLENRPARRAVENLFETVSKTNKHGGTNISFKLNRKAVQSIVDNIGDSRRYVTKNAGKIFDNATDVKTYKKIRSAVNDPAAVYQNTLNKRYRKNMLKKAIKEDEKVKTAFNSMSNLREKLRKADDDTESPLMNYLVEHPEKINKRIERAIRLERGVKGVNELNAAINAREKLIGKGDSARDWILNNTGARGLFNKTLSRANDVSDNYNKTMSTYKKAKGVIGSIGTLTVGAALAKRSKRKEQQMRDRVEEEMLDEYFFGRYR